MKMPFGKYQDREMTEIPKQYLRWLLTQQWLGGWLVDEINDVLNGKVVADSDKTFEELLAEMKESENGK